MKTILILTLLCFSFTSSADSLTRPEGLFEFSGLSVSQIRDFEVVPQQNTERVQQLLADHYECSMITSFYKCKKFLKDMDLPGVLASKINNEWEKTKVIFKKSASEPTLVNDADSIQEWDVFDTAVINQDRAEMYRHWVINGDLHKLKIETANNTYYPLLLNEKQLSFPTETTVSSGHFKWKTYNVDVIFRKKL